MKVLVVCIYNLSAKSRLPPLRRTGVQLQAEYW